jgi:hypothetical protein
MSKYARVGATVLTAVAASTVLQVTQTAPVSAASPLRDRIVSVASGEAGNSGRNAENPMGSNCNYYSGQMGTGNAGCGPSGWRAVAWCADFSEWVWMTAGVTDRNGINSWAYSFWRYGLAKGTWHPARTGYTPQPGDAVVFDWDPSFNPNNWEDIDHVGIVASASGGTVQTIEGNASNRIQRRSYGVDDARIVGYTSPAGESGGGGGSYSDGTLLREPNGSIAVVAGGAVYSFASMDELNAAGYGGKPYVSVPAGHLATMPAEPRDGTLVRNPADGGSIAVIAGGAKFSFSTMEDLSAAGYGGRPFVNIPNRAFNAITTTPGNGVLLRRSDGSISVVAGGAAFSFASMEELNAAGYGGKPFTNVGWNAWNAVPSTPRDGTLIRRSDGSIAVTAGGAAFSFASMEELNATGYGTKPFTNIGWNAYNAVPSAPRDGTLVRDPATGSIAVTAGGARFFFASMDELNQAGYGSTPFTNITMRTLTALPTVARDGTFVRSATDAGPWRITGGKRAQAAAPAGTTVTTLPLGAFQAIPLA